MIRIQELFAVGLHTKTVVRLLPWMRVLDGIDLDVRAGAVFSLLTPGGAVLARRTAPSEYQTG
ncbi:hypothetical protein V6V47_29100 [Micromonospora sp. CPCC 205539]|uniref:hypothetical protein n=1 Tax=Micromonospora sp. CPCC 205539 TaxID=3122408 RepID=UPI002FF393C0